MTVLIDSRITVAGGMIDRWIGMSLSSVEAMFFQASVFIGESEQTCDFHSWYVDPTWGYMSAVFGRQYGSVGAHKRTFMVWFL